MKLNSTVDVTRLRGRAALYLFSCVLLPAALLASACSDDDDATEDTADGAVEGGHGDGATSRDGGDASREAGDAAAADAGTDVRLDVGSDVTPTDASDGAADARADAAPGDASTDALDGRVTLDAQVDVNVDSGPADVSPAPTDAVTPDSGVDGSTAALEAGSSEGAAPGIDAGAGNAADADADADADAASEAAAPDADAATPPTLQYSFENGVQGWAKDVPTDATIGSVTTSTAQHDTGTSSLAVTFTSDSNDGTLLSVDAPPGLVPGKVVTVRVFIPDNVVSWFDIYDSDANYNWADDYFQADEPEPFTLHTGGWYTYTHRIRTATEGETTVPRVGPIQRLGFKIGLIGPGTIYIDSITW